MKDTEISMGSRSVQHKINDSKLFLKLSEALNNA